MRYLVTGNQMKRIDRYTIQSVGIPSAVLMERAALAVADTVEELAITGLPAAGSPLRTLSPADITLERQGRMAGMPRQCHNPSVHIQAVCGTGNNGADGIAAGRILHNKGYKVTVIIAGDPQRGTEEFHLQRRIAQNLGMRIVEWNDFLPGECDILIDAVFGVGLSRPVEGKYREVLQMMENAGASKVVAVDMPSGIHSDTGQVLGAAVRADVTVTFGYKKLGSVLYPGREYCGLVKVCDIGFAADSIRILADGSSGGSMGDAQRPGMACGVTGDEGRPGTACEAAVGAADDTLSTGMVRGVAVTFGPEDLDLLPPRPAYSNKGTFGKVLVVAGSENMGGAAYLSALAAYRMGAGLVKVMTVEENRLIMQELLPEAILATYRSGEMEEEPETFQGKVEKECAWADVIVLGPGVGQGVGVYELMRAFLTNAYVPMILDADGLNAAARYPELAQYFTENIIVTPHIGEMARLTGLTVEQIRRDVVGVAEEYSTEHGITCVLKDAATVVCGRDGQIYVNESGNSCMAKAGSGDVLTGVIAGLLVQGCEPWDAAALGVYLHGAAGDRIREKEGSYGMLARELADEAGRLPAESGGMKHSGERCGRH